VDILQEKVIVFENLRNAPQPSSPAWTLMAHTKHTIKILCDQIENRQMAIWYPVNRWKLL